MKRYILAHWRGELSLAKSFLLNGLVGYFLLLALLIGGQSVINWPGYFYFGGALFLVWEVWAAVGIVRCAFRTFREPHSTFGPAVARRGFCVLAILVTAAMIYYTTTDLVLLLRQATVS